MSCVFFHGVWLGLGRPITFIIIKDCFQHKTVVRQDYAKGGSWTNADMKSQPKAATGGIICEHQLDKSFVKK
jgi:hypothetical protein